MYVYGDHLFMGALHPDGTEFTTDQTRPTAL